MANHIKYFAGFIETATSHIHFIDIFLALLGLYIFSAIHQRLTTKGPMLWPLLGLVPSFILHFNEIYEWTTRELIKNGGAFRYKAFYKSKAQGIFTSDPVKIEYMLKIRFSNFPKGKYYRERFHELLGDGIFNADGDIWKAQRRIATGEMHTSRFVEYSLKVMQSLVHDKLLKLIEKHGGGVIDLQEWLLRFTFDNVCIVAFGVDPGCLRIELPEVSFAKAFEEATEYSTFRFLVPPFVWKTMRYFNVGKERKLKHAVKVVHEFAEDAVKNRKVDIISNLIDTPGADQGSRDYYDTHQQFNDLLSRLLIRAKQDQEGDLIKSPEKSRMNEMMISDKFLGDLCISFILAGRDTSSVGLAWFFWLIHKNPQVESKILSEINEIIKHRKKSNKESDRDKNGTVVFQTEELDKMVYLQAALSESMRLYPPVPMDFKEVQEDDIYPDGTKVQKGDRIVYHMYAMGRMESIWGKDCTEYKPERWFKEDGIHLVSENQFKYAVFNAGPRLCAGKKFAYLQMKIIVASILMRYKVNVIEDQVIAPKQTTTLYMQNGMLVNFQPRKSLVLD